uniref:Uncharacterized protein n=1 Tax=Oryza brachyantha TaxID=4533 RepID=J3MTX8_ORYBR
MALEAVVFSEGYYFGCGGAMAAEAAAGGAWSWSHGYGGGVEQGKGVMELMVDDGANAYWDAVQSEYTRTYTVENTRRIIFSACHIRGILTAYPNFIIHIVI